MSNNYDIMEGYHDIHERDLNKDQVVALTY